MSTNTGLSPSRQATSAAETKVKSGMMTSSPSSNGSAISAICSASVPLAQGITWRTPKYCSKFCWKSFTSLPLMKADSLMTFRSRFRSFLRICLYCERRSTIWRFFMVGCLCLWITRIQRIFVPLAVPCAWRTKWSKFCWYAVRVACKSLFATGGKTNYKNKNFLVSKFLLPLPPLLRRGSSVG